MTFEEWRDANEFGDCSPRAAWEAAWDKQQRVIDEMHLAFRGHVLVPVKPTEKMIEAGYNAYVNSGWIRTYEIYEAMIQAAQEEE